MLQIRSNNVQAAKYNVTVQKVETSTIRVVVMYYNHKKPASQNDYIYDNTKCLE